MTKKYHLRPTYRKGKDSSSSSSESDEDSARTSDTEYTDYTSSDDSSNNKKKFNRKQFQKTLSKMFPSTYMSEKVKRNDRSPKAKKRRTESPSESEEECDEEEDEYSSEEEDGHSSDEDSSSSYNTAEADEEQKFNIFFTIQPPTPENNADDEYSESDEEEECNSDDEKTFMKETYEKVEEPAVLSPRRKGKNGTKKDRTNKGKRKHSRSDKHRKEREDENGGEKADSENENSAEKEYVELLELKKQFVSELQKKPNNKVLQRAVLNCKDEIRTLIRKARKKNAKRYHKLIQAETKQTNELEYFKTKLSNKEQRKAMEDLKEINAHIYTDTPYRLSLLKSDMSAKMKAIAMQKLNVLRSMDPGDNEYYKIKNWVDTFMKIPFGIYKTVSVSMNDGLDKCNEFMTNAKQTLDSCAYGLNDAKLQIMQMLGQWIVNPTSLGTAIAIHGPMGTGKTTLVKDGISKILGREFTFIALGGSGDASFLEGHSYTYEGSTWGKIVQTIIDSKCMNPVIYFDELDKVSDTARGQEIIGILTHLTDTSQNSQFHDKYFSEVDFDLSKCLFIFSYNDETLINPILKDRMYRIRTKGYETNDKVIIARQHLLPKIREQVSFSETDVIIPDETIKYIINRLTKNESGVRNLKRCLETIFSKLNLFRLITPDNQMFSSDIRIPISFPMTITSKEVDAFVKSEEVSHSMLAMYT
jgi:ATP-dependent Lon protease